MALNRAYLARWLVYAGWAVLGLGLLLLLIWLVMQLAQIGWIVALAGLLMMLIGQLLRRI